jgi:hypothetical protein
MPQRAQPIDGELSKAPQWDFDAPAGARLEDSVLLALMREGEVTVHRQPEAAGWHFALEGHDANASWPQGAHGHGRLDRLLLQAPVFGVRLSDL